MSNYIYNDNFEDQAPEHVKIIYAGEQKKRSPVALIICTALIVCAGIMFLIGGILNYISSENEKKNVPVFQINTLPKENADTNASLLANSTASLTTTIKNVKDSVVEIITATNGKGIGSGVIVGGPSKEISYGEKCYYVVTNAHVIQGTYTDMYIPVKVALNDGTVYEAEVYEVDSKSDLAILKITEPNKSLCIAPWATSDTELLLGEQVIAIGNPLGELGGTVTVGYLSALSREVTVSGNKMKLLQFDAAVNRGNSGGGLFNARGELIGIVNAKVADFDVEGIGFAIPFTDINNKILEYIQYSYIKGQPTIGAKMVFIETGNIFVSSTDSKSLLKAGDTIKEIKLNEADGFVPVTAQSLQEILNMRIDDTFKLKVQRGNMEITLKITVYEYSK